MPSQTTKKKTQKPKQPRPTLGQELIVTPEMHALVAAPVQYKDDDVVGLAQISRAHLLAYKHVRRIYDMYKDDMEIGKHRHLLPPSEWKPMVKAGIRLLNETGGETISPPDKYRGGGHHGDLVLLTKYGYLLLVKHFNDAYSWKVYQWFVNDYFRLDQADKARRATGVEETPATRNLLNEILATITRTVTASTTLAIEASLGRMEAFFKQMRFNVAATMPPAVAATINDLRGHMNAQANLLTTVSDRVVDNGIALEAKLAEGMESIASQQRQTSHVNTSLAHVVTSINELRTLMMQNAQHEAQEGPKARPEEETSDGPIEEPVWGPGMAHHTDKQSMVVKIVWRFAASCCDGDSRAAFNGLYDHFSGLSSYYAALIREGRLMRDTRRSSILQYIADVQANAIKNGISASLPNSRPLFDLYVLANELYGPHGTLRKQARRGAGMGTH